ncbi:hypothetical protein NEUTE2DRAFT_54242 [Neurospora tetrasperma FGSC 2509]|nr:hypothetical protein NEUTE2DRAFT_54242 [Neurospora tetrasperma FGSC 2509]
MTGLLDRTMNSASGTKSATASLLTLNNSILASQDRIRSFHLRLLSDTELTDDTGDEEERSPRYPAQLHERAGSQPSLTLLNDDERIAL